MIFLLFLNLKFILARVFRLKHPEKNLFIGGPDFYPFFTCINSSNVFEDEESANIADRILIKVKDSKNKVWDVESSGKNLIYYGNHGGKNQLFTVIHLARDVVAIESSLGGCFQYVEENNRFELADCAIETNYFGQVFLITDEDGVWKGCGSYAEGWGTPSEASIKWGICPTCIPGGFGSIEQGGPLELSFTEERARNKELADALLLGENMGYDSVIADLVMDYDDFEYGNGTFNEFGPGEDLKGPGMSKYRGTNRRGADKSIDEYISRKTPAGTVGRGKFHSNEVGNGGAFVNRGISNDKMTEAKNIMEIGESYPSYGAIMSGINRGIRSPDIFTGFGLR